MSEPSGASRRDLITTALLVFLIAAVGSTVTFAFWSQSLVTAQVVFLGSGNRLSLLVTDGPARLLIATGDSSIHFENALMHVRPLFARRIDVLLIAGDGNELLVPLAASGDSHVRTMFALAPLPESPEATAVGRIAPLSSPQRIRVGATVHVTVETALPLGVDADEKFPAWRAIIERGETRIVVLSDGSAVSLFPPELGASVLAVSGNDPAAAWDPSPAVAFVANAGAITGPEMRSAFLGSRRSPAWGFRVFPGEALRVKFVAGGVEMPSAQGQELAAQH